LQLNVRDPQFEHFWLSLTLEIDRDA
jgi:hypothetical protein